MHPLLFLVGVGVRIALPEPGLRAALVQHAGSLGRQYVGRGGGGMGWHRMSISGQRPLFCLISFGASMAMFICIALLEDRNGLDQRGSNWDQGVTHPRHTPQASFYQSSLGEPDCFKQIAVACVLHPNN